MLPASRQIVPTGHAMSSAFSMPWAFGKPTLTEPQLALKSDSALLPITLYAFVLSSLKAPSILNTVPMELAMPNPLIMTKR